MEFALPPAPGMILEKMSADGFSCYLVGGSVRDLLLSRRPADYDFVTDRHPAQIIAAARDAGWKVLQHGIAFGVVNVLVQGKSYEIATMRTEAYGADPHRPAAVEFLSDIEKDLARRDFTINAMAMDRQGRIIDPFGGQDDLKREIIRCVGNPRDRFLEDPLRILRAARFIAKTCFTADPGIAAAAGDRDVRRRFVKLSVERLRDELEKILLSPLPSRGLRYLIETGILELSCSGKISGKKEAVPILPEIAAMQGVRQNPRFHAHDVLEHTLKAVDGIPAQPVLRWAALLHDVAKGRAGIRCLNKQGELADYGHAGAGAKLAQNILERLRISAETTHMVVWLVRNHMVLPDVGDGRMARWVKKRSRDFADREAFVKAAQQLFLLADADNRARGKGTDPAYIEAVTGSFQRVLAEAVLYPAELEISGAFIAQKVGRGPLIGKILRDLLMDVQTGRLENSREALQAAVDKKAKRLTHTGNTNN
ncbi:MAG: CCA tRNA nucleotidyltransferase [Bacillota bacterium]